MVDPKELRVDTRKILRCAATVLLQGSIRLRARALDISMNGISLMLTEQIPTALQCVIVFEAPANGKMVKVSVGAKAIYCTCVGTSGFRCGFQFDKANEVAAKAIRQLLQ